MGYRVEYCPVKKVRGAKKRVSRKVMLTALCLLLFCTLVGILWPEGTEVLRLFLFPGDPAVTVAALEELTAELRTGVPLSDSFRIFCLRIMEGSENVTVP